MAKAKNNFYAVLAGRQPGIYKTWAECQRQVIGFKGAKFKGFVTLEEAEAFMGSRNGIGAARKGKRQGSGDFSRGTLRFVDRSCTEGRYSWGVGA